MISLLLQQFLILISFEVANPGVNNFKVTYDNFRGDTVIKPITHSINGFGLVPTTGNDGTAAKLPYGGTIVEASMVLEQTGSAVVDIWIGSSFVPTNSDSITAAAPLTISSGTSVTDSTLTGWTTTFAEDDWIVFNVDSVSTATIILVQLKVEVD